MSSRSVLTQAFAMVCVVLVLSGCSGASVTSTSGAISGKVLGDDMKPIAEMEDKEKSIVALYCERTDIECLDASLWEMDIEELVNSICEPGDEDPTCLLHFGQGAAVVEDDGSYTIANVPPGEYGVILMFPAVTLRKAVYDNSVQTRKVTEVDFVLDFHA